MRHTTLANLLARTSQKGSIARQVAFHRVRAARAAAEVVKHHDAIAALQQSCAHTWKFSNQVNNYHNELWNVMEKCVECDSTREIIGKPICEACGYALNRAAPEDQEAAQERNKPCYRPSYMPPDNNPPIAFRCPQCSKIHILWVLGD